MIAPADLDHCRASIRTGSYSFHAASRLLPGRVRDPALVLYAFCRLADDAVDETEAKAAAVLRLRDRLDLCYQGRPLNAPEDRAFAAMVAQYDMPQALPEALLEGFAWDAEGRRYDTLSGVLAYSARVASAVGAMMCVLMGVRDADRLARACDLGLAMQLTNIARDVGEDARAGRLYLPLDWLDAAGVDVAGFLADPRPTPAITVCPGRCGGGGFAAGLPSGGGRGAAHLCRHRRMRRAERARQHHLPRPHHGPAKGGAGHPRLCRGGAGATAALACHAARPPGTRGGVPGQRRPQGCPEPRGPVRRDAGYPGATGPERPPVARLSGRLRPGQPQGTRPAAFTPTARPSMIARCAVCAALFAEASASAAQAAFPSDR
jgi:hypothetical protein